MDPRVSQAKSGSRAGRLIQRNDRDCGEANDPAAAFGLFRGHQIIEHLIDRQFSQHHVLGDA